MFNIMSDGEFVQAEKMCLLIEDIGMVANALQVKVVFGTEAHQAATDVCDCYVEIYPPSERTGVIQALEALGMDFGGEDMNCSYIGPQCSKHVFTWPIGYHPLRDAHSVELGPGGGAQRWTLGRGVTYNLEERAPVDEVLGRIANSFAFTGRPTPDMGKRYYSNFGSGNSLFEVHDITPTIDNPGGSHHIWGDGALTPKRAAEKRQRSKTHVNGRPKKGWQR